ncbi:MAG: GNAT family N-acetyltransferase [Acidobacteriota bacterium]
MNLVASALTHPTSTAARSGTRAGRAQVVRYRKAVSADADRIHALVAAHAAEGHLLPRGLDELRLRAHRFVVAIRDRRIVGCAELAPLSARVAEVRSLVVDPSARHLGIGSTLVAALARTGRRAGFLELCAFTHDAGYFVRRGFSIVSHDRVPEKIALDCLGCPLFGDCGQQAVVRPLTRHAGTARRSQPPAGA